MSKLEEYWVTATKLSTYSGKPRLWVLAKMLACRLLYNFGPQDYVLFNFNRKPFNAAKTYLRKHQLEALQSSINKKAVRHKLDNKLEFNIKCRQYNLPSPEILAVVARHGYEKYHDDFTFIDTTEALGSLLNVQGNGRYLFKLINGSHGIGIVRFYFKENKFLNDDEQEIDLSHVFSADAASCYILQKCLSPHTLLKQVMPDGSLGTVRMVTKGCGETFTLLLPCLRIPVGANVADNFSHGKANNLIAAVDHETGLLYRPYASDSAGLGLVEERRTHPSNQFVIEGFQFPFWQEMVDLVKQASLSFSEFNTVGWDVALTENGPCLIEGNWRYDCDLLQVAFNRGLKVEFSKLLG